ncbi:MAG: lysoplasmalogenase family protein [Peptostreptococcaceae bacterium]
MCITSRSIYKENNNFTYYYFTLNGLTLSLLGDVFLAFKPKIMNNFNIMFLLGFISFSLAHISYIVAFNSLIPITYIVLLTAFVLSCFVIIQLICNVKLNFGTYIIPCIIYVLIIK